MKAFLNVFLPKLTAKNHVNEKFHILLCKPFHDLQQFPFGHDSTFSPKDFSPLEQDVMRDGTYAKL